jgi:phosphoglucosamine mutase
MGHYFGTDGVRGKANHGLTVSMALTIGQALGALYPGQKIVVGMDTRLSSGMLKHALLAGLAATSARAFDAGVVPTPAIAYLTANLDFAAGVMISASHNPYDDNGIKIFSSSGYKIDESLEAQIEAVLDGKVTLQLAIDAHIGTIEVYPEGLQAYTDYLQNLFDMDLTGFNIAVDTANGSATVSAKPVLEAFGATVHAIANQPNGININAHCGSTHPQALQTYVTDHDSDLGLAFDGDADRLIAVDEHGELVDGDAMLYLVGKYLKKNNELHENTVVTTVMANLGLHKALAQHGITTVQTPVGDKYVVERMLNGRYSLGGEQSGHIVFKDYLTTGDGLLTALALLKIMSDEQQTLAQLKTGLTIYPQTLRNVRVNDKKNAIKHPKLSALVETLSAQLGSDGRILVRPSGTEPLVRVMAEAATQAQCDDLVATIVRCIEEENL